MWRIASLNSTGVGAFLEVASIMQQMLSNWKMIQGPDDTSVNQFNLKIKNLRKLVSLKAKTSL